MSVASMHCVRVCRGPSTVRHANPCLRPSRHCRKASTSRCWGSTSWCSTCLATPPATSPAPSPATSPICRKELPTVRCCSSVIRCSRQLPAAVRRHTGADGGFTGQVRGHARRPQVCCTHGYTLSKLRFASAVEPSNAAPAQYTGSCVARREAAQPTLHSSVALERAINPFLRCTEPAVVRAAQAEGAHGTDAVSVLVALREWKNRFR